MYLNNDSVALVLAILGVSCKHVLIGTRVNVWIMRLDNRLGWGL